MGSTAYHVSPGRQIRGWKSIVAIRENTNVYIDDRI